MRIYTKTGDGGETSLANNQRVSKADPRLETYGTADELNAWIGMLRASLSGMEETDKQLLWIQNKLFNLGASLSEAEGVWITAEDVARMEQWIDAMQGTLTPVRAFILPAGNEAVARCHVCRTVARRLERLMVAIEHPRMDERRLINRLSDYLFVLARWVGEQTDAPLWTWEK